MPGTLRKQIVINGADAQLRAVNAINGLGFDDLYEVVIRPFKRPRTYRQERRYRAILNEIAEQARTREGKHPPIVWHHYFKMMFLSDVKESVNGVPVVVHQSNRELSARKMSDYTEQVIAHAVTEFNVSFSDEYDAA